MIKSDFGIVAVMTFMGIASLCLITGCDINGSDSADSPITVSPSSVTLTKGQSQEFTASGGYEYTWSMSQSGGKLNTTKGPSVVFTLLSTNGTMPIKVIAKSTISGTSSGTPSTTNSTGTTAYEVEGYAEVFWPVGSATSTNSSSSTNSP